MAQNNQINLINPTMAAKTTNPFPTSMYDAIVVTADALIGAETVNIQVMAGTTAIQVVGLDGSTPATLTAGLSGLALEGGPAYVFVKSTTASACGLYVDPRLK